MAARRNPRHDDKTRERIKASQLINRLQDCVFGKIEMSPSQVRAATALLGKVLPDLSSVDMAVTGEQTHYVVSGSPMTEEEWETRYGGGAKPETRH